MTRLPGLVFLLSTACILHAAVVIHDPYTIQDVRTPGLSQEEMRFRENLSRSAREELPWRFFNLSDTQQVTMQTLAQRAFELVNEGQGKDVLAALQALIRADDGSLELRRLHAHVLYLMGRLDECLEALLPLVQIADDNATLHLMLGVVQGEAGLIDDALTSFEKVLSLNPDSEDALNNMALMQLGAERHAEALEYMGQAVLAHPQSTESLRIFIQSILAWAGAEAPEHIDVEEGLQKYERAVKLLTGESADSNAVAHLARAFALNPDHAGVANDLGVILIGSGHAAAGIALLTRAVALDEQGQGAARSNLESALQMLHMQEQLIREIEQWEQRLDDPSVAIEARINLSHLYQAAGDLAKARHYLEEALQHDPDNKSVLMILAELEMIEGRTAEARGRYRSILAKDPTDPDAMLGLALVYLQSSTDDTDIAEALLWATRANRVTDGSSPRVLQILAASQALTGDFASAVQSAQTGSRLAAQNDDSELATILEIDVRQYESWRDRNEESPKNSSPIK